jgi:hypothetical protein
MYFRLPSPALALKILQIVAFSMTPPGHPNQLPLTSGNRRTRHGPIKRSYHTVTAQHTIGIACRVKPHDISPSPIAFKNMRRFGPAKELIGKIFVFVYCSQPEFRSMRQEVGIAMDWAGKSAGVWHTKRRSISF